MSNSKSPVRNFFFAQSPVRNFFFAQSPVPNASKPPDRYADRMKLSEVDQVIVRYADTLSPAELSFKIDGVLSPEQVMARIGRLLESREWLDSAQQDRLVTLKMRQLIVDLEEMKLSPRVAETLIRALESLGVRLERRTQATERDLHTLYAFQGAVMLDAINAAMAHMRGSITALDGVSEEAWDAAMEASIRFAQLEIGRYETVDA